MIHKKSFLVLCEGAHEDFSDDGQRAGMDKYRGEVVLRIERASLFEFGHDKYHLTIATVGKAYLRSTETGFGRFARLSAHLDVALRLDDCEGKWVACCRHP